MTIRGACDRAYTRLVSTQEAQATALWAVAAGNGQGDKVPPPSVIKDQIDAMLTAASKPIDPEELELRRALGVL